jgi:hypothetical protein
MRAMLEVSTDYGYCKQWVVHLVQYPGQSDPLMEGLEARKPKP